MSFEQVIGQETIKSKLKQLVRKNRLSHAILLHGGEGVGKKALALALAQYIVCEQANENDACGVCPACKKAQKLIHPDIHFIFPVIKDGSTKAISDSYLEKWREYVKVNPYFTYPDWNQAIGDGKKASSIYVDESSEIIKKLNYKPFEAEYKVMIIWLAEKMNVQTANKLLKTLEEPSNNTLLLLIAENTDYMLSTILSRVQQIKIPPIAGEDLKPYLTENYEADEDQINFAIHYGKGNFSKTVEALHQAEQNIQYLEWFMEYMRLSYRNSMLDLMSLNDAIIAQEKNEIIGFLNYALRYIRDNFMLNLNQSDRTVLPQNEREFAENFSKFITGNNIEKIYSSLNQCILNLQRNANAKIQLQILSIELIRAFKMV
ncbi:MAG: hypothetical protein JXR60_09205 [Bacteroidales bacterium]|nr:hypothetical protein [Bacteroidales bacterium]